MQADLRPARCAWLIVIALGHVAVLMAWRPTARQAIDAAPRVGGELVFVTMPPAKPRDEMAPPPRTGVAHRSRQALAEHLAPPPAAGEASQPAISPPANADFPADPFAKPVVPSETLRDKVRKSVAGIDRQLRKESLNKFATIVNEDTALGLAISGGPAPKLSAPESYMGANGIVHKRYMLRGKVVCEEVDHIGVGGGDPFRSGSRARLVQCPR